MSDILSICVQDILYGRKSKLRAKISSCAEVISSGVMQVQAAKNNGASGPVSCNSGLYKRILICQCLYNGSCLRDFVFASLDHQSDCLCNPVHILRIHSS